MLEQYKQLAQYQVPDKFYRMKLDRLLQRAAGGKFTPKQLFGTASDDFWLWLHTDGHQQCPELLNILGGIPEEKVQLNTTGGAGNANLTDGFIIYKWIKEIYEASKGGLSACSNVLDFGCGWGRVIRFFLRDLEPSQIWGIDHYDKILEICKQLNKWGNFQWVKSFPPTSLPDETFDLIFCFSVFSHLSEDAHRQWLAEFKRILKPGGMVLATTWDRDLIVRCGESKKSSNLPFFQQHLPTMFADTKKWLANYDSGKFCFDSSKESYGEISYFLGEACIPQQYVLNEWTKYFEFLDFINDRTVCAQNIIVVRK